LSPEQSGKVEYERERLLGIADKLMNLAAFRARFQLFRFAWGTTLIEIAVSFSVQTLSLIKATYCRRLPTLVTGHACI
jgi:hypothetical protein